MCAVYSANGSYVGNYNTNAFKITVIRCPIPLINGKIQASYKYYVQSHFNQDLVMSDYISNIAIGCTYSYTLYYKNGT